MNYVGVVIIGIIVGFVAQQIFTEKLIGVVGNVLLAIAGAVMGAYFVYMSGPPIDPLQAQIFCGLGGSILAVLGGNFAYRLIKPSGESLNKTVFREEMQPPR